MSEQQELLRELESEILDLQKKIPALSGDSLYRAAKSIVEKMDAHSALLNIEPLDMEGLPVGIKLNIGTNHSPIKM